jgi:hypothetical protein
MFMEWQSGNIYEFLFQIWIIRNVETTKRSTILSILMFPVFKVCSNSCVNPVNETAKYNAQEML